MPQPQPLGRSLVPIPGESLPGFLLRLSFRLELPPARVAELTGLRSSGYRESRVPAILVAGIPAAALPVFTRMTRLTDGQAAQLGLAGWQGRYPVLAADTAAGFRRLNSQTVFAPATRYCPDCLAGDGSAIQESFGGPWLKAWHLPVVFACPAHQRLLEHRCPECGQVVRGHRPRAQSAVLPAMRVPGLHAAQCRAELTLSSGGRSLPACCGARLDQAGHRRLAGTELTALQVKILDLLGPDGPVSALSAGQPAQPIRYFADLRALGLLACSTWPAARPLSPTEEAASAIDEHVASLQREAAGQQGTSSSASHVRSGFPPMDAAASGALAHIADRILAGNPDEVRERLKLLLPPGKWKDSRTYWGLRAVRSATPCSEGLHAAYAPLLWRFTKAGSRPQGRRNAVIQPQRWGPENIPAFLPEDWYSRHFRPLTGVSPRFIRRTAALRLVQMVVGGSLGEAAGFLGIATTGTTYFNKSGIYTWAGRVHTTARQQPDPLGFETALQALARELDDPATLLVNYRQRRQVLETWCIDEDTWADLTARMPTVPGSRRPDFRHCHRHVASIYVWVKVTSGEHRFAPRPVEAAQPPEIQEAWKGRRRSAIWSRMNHSLPGPYYASLKTGLYALATTLARTIDQAGSPPPPQ
jgi:hypothetical protein